MAQRLDRKAALADEVADVRAATATAEALGRRGRDDLARLREQKVSLQLVCDTLCATAHDRFSRQCALTICQSASFTDNLAQHAAFHGKRKANRESQVELALVAAADLPQLPAAPTPWSIWALSLALLCNIILVGSWIRRRAL